MIRKYDENNKAIHLTYKNEEVDSYLTETLKKKLKTASLDYDVTVRFDKTYQNPKTKLVKINKNKEPCKFLPNNYRR